MASSFTSGGEELAQPSFWERTAESVHRLSERPGSIFFGVMQGMGVISSAWAFANTFQASERGSMRFRMERGESHILSDRIMAGFGLTGSLARFGGWVHTECFAAAGGELTSSLLGGIGSGVGLIRSGSRTFEVLDDWKETDRLSNFGEKMSMDPEMGFRNTPWIQALNLTSNILFACFSVVGLLALCFSSFILAPLSAMCLFGSLMMTLASFLMKLGNSEEEQKLNLLKANDMEKNYVC